MAIAPNLATLDGDPKKVGASLSELALALILALCVAVLLSKSARYFSTPTVSDEIKYLLSARYLFSNVDIGEFGKTMRGYDFLLVLMGIPFGGLRHMALGEAYAHAQWLNLAAFAAVILLSYGVLRWAQASRAVALAGSVAVATYPLFFVYVPLVMTETVFAVLSIAYAFATVSYLERPLGVTFGAVALSAIAIASVKAVGTYCLIGTCITAITLFGLTRRVVALSCVSLGAIVAVRFLGASFITALASFSRRTVSYRVS